MATTPWWYVRRVAAITVGWWAADVLAFRCGLNVAGTLMLPVGVAIAWVLWEATWDAVPSRHALLTPSNRHLQTTGRLCRSCGYDLWATPERCPECGAAPTWKTAPDDDADQA